MNSSKEVISHVFLQIRPKEGDSYTVYITDFYVIADFQLASACEKCSTIALGRIFIIEDKSHFFTESIIHFYSGESSEG